MIFDLENKNDKLRFLLYKAIEIHQLYLKQNFSLDMLAVYMGCSKSKASTLVRKKYGIGFLELTNRLRINYIKLLVKKYGRNLSIAEYAEFAGFSTKGSLFLHFKRQVGMDFNEYLNERNKGDLKNTKGIN